MGASHVRHRRRTAGLLLAHDVPHRGADGDQVSGLDRHNVARQLTLETPMLFAVGFLATFLLGGLTGALLASPPLDFHIHDTYFVVAHFHYVLFGTVVFSVFAGIHFWFPEMTDRMMDETLGKIHFWTVFIRFHLTFLVQHWLGDQGSPAATPTT
jgi:heme/copper-type cytochrome/quinol oxidase subunit 1